MRVWVTGAGGFVGGHLLPRLRACGHEARGADRECDVTEARAVEDALEALRPDAVIHMAALSSVAASDRDPRAVYRTNYLGSLVVLRAVQRVTPGARLLLIGSGEVYGKAAPGRPPFDESAPLRPRSPYAATKAAADRLGSAFAARGLDVVRVRAFTHTGPGQSDTFVASSFARQLAEMETAQAPQELAVGNLDSVRDFLDVADVVEAYVQLLDRARVPAGVYNVASGVPVRIGDLLDTLLSLARVQPVLRVDERRVRPADWSVGDAARLRAATGWTAKTPLRETLARLLETWRAELSAA